MTRAVEFVLLAVLLSANVQLFFYSRAIWRQLKALRRRQAEELKKHEDEK